MSAAAQPGPGPLDETEVAFAGVEGQARLLTEGRITSTELVDLLLRRIERLQPRLNAFRAVLADSARREAADADAARQRGDRRPLLGVPVAVKDNVAVTGQAALFGTGSPERVATDDDELVRRLRAAGLVVLGLTQLPELALWAATESAHHGITRNPWDRSRAPGGSSGGSAVAVAAGLVAAAHGTDSLGSIRLPASACGLVGLKPTHGTVPLGPDIDHWEGLTHAGFLTRTVRDSALLLDAVVSPSPRWTASLDDPGVRPPLRIAASRKPSSPARVAPEVRKVHEAALDALRRLGHDVRDQDPPLRGVSNAATVRYAAGVAHDLDGLVDPAATEGRTRTIARIGRRLPRGLVDRARDQGTAFADRMAAFFADVDVLVTPTTPALPVAAGRILGKGLVSTMRPMVPRAAFTGPWNACGLPAVSIPFALTGSGLPVGVQLVGPRGSDGRLLALAAALERISAWPQRRPPVD